MTKKLSPIHPGEVLLADFLEPLSLSQYRLAHSISVPPRRINEIVHGKRAVTADTALRLARFLHAPDHNVNVSLRPVAPCTRAFVPRCGLATLRPHRRQVPPR